MAFPPNHSGLTLTKIEQMRDQASAWHALERAFVRDATRTKRSLGAGFGSRDCPLLVREDLQTWMSKPIEIARGYIWVPFGTLPMKPLGNLNMVVQLNRPTPRTRGRIKGALLAVDGAGDRWICHTGDLGGNRAGIAGKSFLGWTNRPAVDVVDSQGKVARALPVARVGDPGMATDVAAFVREVAAFKDGGSKRRSSDPDSESAFTGDSSEREGAFAVAPRAGYEAVRHHAMVRNRLAHLLSDVRPDVTRDLARDIIVGKPERPELEFEVKPLADPQSVYTAIGQLMMHSVKHPARRRVAVLPSRLRAEYRSALGKLGIDLVTFTVNRHRIEFDGLDRVVPGVASVASLKPPA